MEKRNRFQPSKILALLTILVGIALLVYMIRVEDEPGFIPPIMILGGIVWFLLSDPIRKLPIVFLQGVVMLIAVIAIVVLIRFPQIEGRAVNLDLYHIYADPFIIFGYVASIPFFVALYQAYKLLEHIGKNEVFTTPAVKRLRNIKYAAIALGGCIILMGTYIRFFHEPGDDPAGFLALCIMATFASAVIATAAAIFERLLQNAIDLKSENDLTI